MTQKILSIGFSLLLSLTVISPALASDFVCRNVHGYGSIIRVDNPLVANETVVSYKTLPDGDWQKATVLDSGEGWVLFDDRYGNYSEPSSSCEKYKEPCGKFTKLFHYGRRIQESYSITQFTTKSCCAFGNSLEKGSVVHTGSVCY